LISTYFLDTSTTTAAVPGRAIFAFPDQAISADRDDDLDYAAYGDNSQFLADSDDDLDYISADGDGNLNYACGDIQATIQEGRALLQEVSGAATDGEADAVMGDETAHKKRSKDDIYDKNFVDPDM
jgi:hypothetical protein